LVRDLNSTNGSFIGGEQITESVLKPGQILRLGQVDVRLESAPPPASTGKKVIDKTQIIPQGVKMNDLESSGQTVIINKETFKGKSNKANKITIAIGIVLAIVIIVFIVIAINIVRGGNSGSPGGSAPAAETAK
jgi:pSer/pThr/pTyr-binding forkhead associated (FHA) protein